MKSFFTKRVALIGAGALIVSPIWAIPAQAAPDGSDVVINEVFARGGSANQAYTNKFIELYNPTDEAISLDGLSLQYIPADKANASATINLSGSVPAEGYFLIQGGSNGSNGAALPTPDLVTTLNTGGGGGVVALVNGTTSLTGLPAGDLSADDRFIDLVGWGTAERYETAVAAVVGGNSDSGSITRTAGADTDNNLADFTWATTPTPQNSGGTGGGDPDPDPDPDPTTTTIAEIQGTGSATPLNGQVVTTRGVVTAVYKNSGFNGVYIQTPGTGGTIGNASHGVFVYSAATANAVDFGDYIEVTGTAGEYFGLTQITGQSYTILDEVVDAPVPTAVTPADLVTDAQREVLEGMLLDVTDVQFTVTDTYQTNVYGQVALAMDDAPLPTETDIYNPVTEKAQHDALVAENASKMLTLDDGSSFSYTNFNFNDHNTPVPYLNTEVPLRVGADVTVSEPVILDYRYQWNLQPVERITGNNDDFLVVEDTRAAIVEAPEVEGDVTIATFNVLNYFTTLGTDLRGCTSYNDRAGNPLTVRGGCDARGAWDADNLARQEGKIVAAIQELDASVVGLEEIENSAAFGKDRDVAVSDLVDALNADAGSAKWAYVESPEVLPQDEDVIRLAFIYQVDEVVPVGDSKILIGSSAFGNAREPLGQAWQALDADGDPAGDQFATITNHFKSKGSGTDDGTGQGNANPDRKAQATALLAFADEEYGDMPVFLVGDFNSYSAEDPMRILEADGYVNLLRNQSNLDGEHYYTYTFGLRAGSLDHILGSADAMDWVTETAVWNINSVESVGMEYSRYNYNVTNLFQADNPFRSSDHDPIKVGLDIPGLNDEVVVTPEAPVQTGNTVSIPTVEGVEYVIDGAVVTGDVDITADTTVTARAIEGYVLAEDAVAQWTFTYVAPIVTVTPEAPVQDGNTVSIPTVEGVEYVIDGAVVTGDVDITADTTVTARAIEGYVLAEGAVAQWTFTYTAPIVTVTPEAPVQAGNTVSIPVVEGVEYVIDGAVVTGDVDITADTTVTARAIEGYVLAEDAVAQWTFEYVAPGPVAPLKGNVFFVANDWTSTEADVVFAFGRRGDEVFVGDWDGDGYDTLAVRRGNTFYGNNTLTGGNAAAEFKFGRVGD
ncbi:ExeM/NucH family extracellular endonuclease, partial [Flaviflexus equikiangi]